MPYLGLNADESNWKAVYNEQRDEASRLISDATGDATKWTLKHVARGVDGVSVWTRAAEDTPSLLTVGRTVFSGVTAASLLRLFASPNGTSLVDPFSQHTNADTLLVFQDDGELRSSLTLTYSGKLKADFLSLDTANFSSCFYTSYSVFDDKWPVDTQGAPPRALLRFAIQTSDTADGCVCDILSHVECSVPPVGLNAYQARCEKRCLQLLRFSNSRRLTFICSRCSHARGNIFKRMHDANGQFSDKADDVQDS